MIDVTHRRKKTLKKHKAEHLVLNIDHLALSIRQLIARP